MIESALITNKIYFRMRGTFEKSIGLQCSN
jgi:hypothetical protein